MPIIHTHDDDNIRLRWWFPLMMMITVDDDDDWRDDSIATMTFTHCDTHCNDNIIDHVSQLSFFLEDVGIGIIVVCAYGCLRNWNEGILDIIYISILARYEYPQFHTIATLIQPPMILLIMSLSENRQRNLTSREYMCYCVVMGIVYQLVSATLTWNRVINCGNTSMDIIIWVDIVIMGMDMVIHNGVDTIQRLHGIDGMERIHTCGNPEWGTCTSLGTSAWG
jgi:hypothetical protein